MFFRMLIVMIVGVMVGFIAARSVRVPPMTAIAQADVASMIAAPDNQGAVLRLYDITDIVESSLGTERRFASLESPVVFSNYVCCFPRIAGNPTVEHIEALIDMFEATIEPDSWDVNGGSASIRYFNGRLAVTQKPAAQLNVAALLDELRQMRPQLGVNPTTAPRDAR